MERHELMAMMAVLSLAEMRAVYNEVMTDGLEAAAHRPADPGRPAGPGACRAGALDPHLRT